MTPTSVIMLTYVHGSGPDALALVSQGNGSFVVSGSKNKDFTYTVLNNQ